MHPRAAELVRLLDLQPHPEGGYYREVFRSAAQVEPADGRGRRAALTSIYFLLVAGTHSRWHQVRSDEAWHLCEGGPLELFEMDAACERWQRHTLGNVGESEGPGRVFAADTWQAARPLSDYVLVGCTVGPGFDFADFRMMADHPEFAELVRTRWPHLAVLI